MTGYGISLGVFILGVLLWILGFARWSVEAFILGYLFIVLSGVLAFFTWLIT